MMISNQLPTLFSPDKSSLKIKLQTAMTHAKRACAFGSDNKIEDFHATNGWVSLQKHRYNSSGKYIRKPQQINNRAVLWRYEADKIDTINFPQINLANHFPSVDPLHDPEFHLAPAQILLLKFAMLSQESNQGNCLDLSCLTAKYLWENSNGINRIELAPANTFDHVFLIINRSGELNNPDTWGDAWIIDPWYGDKGIIYPASEFKTKIAEIKQFAKQQFDEFAKLDLSPAANYFTQDEEKLQQVVCEIKPARDRYPTYSVKPFYPVEYYYQLGNIYPGEFHKKYNDLTEINEAFTQHKLKFKDCLDQLNHSNNLFKV